MKTFRQVAGFVLPAVVPVLLPFHPYRTATLLFLAVVVLFCVCRPHIDAYGRE